MGEQVGNGVRGSGNVFECIIEILEELDPVGLSVGNFLWVMEKLKVAIIGANTGWERGA